MNPELERLIDLALADGVITDKEREVMYRKAQELGVDMDEFEMVLEAKVHLASKGANSVIASTSGTSNMSNSHKERDFRKCPSCGAAVQSFATVCSDCGHEFRNAQSTQSVVRLFEMLNQLEQTRKDDETNPLKAMGAMYSKMFAGQSAFGGGKLGQQKKEIIRNFPIPNTKEDLLEFLAMGAARATKKGGPFAHLGPHGLENIAHNELVLIWRTKCEEIIMKARFSMKNDRSTLAEVEAYAKQLKIK